MPVRWLEWIAVLFGAVAIVGGAIALYLRRSARRTVFRFRPRINRYKLTRKSEIVATLLAEPELAEAVRRHASEHGVAEVEVWLVVRAYLDEIIPFFNVLAYY